MINIGSTVAFNAIVSLNLMALMSTYTISIGCVLWRRTFGRHDPLPTGRWSLGRWGIVCNIISVVYTVFVLFWAGWPEMRNPAVDSINWGPIMFGVVFLISAVYYTVHGRKVYRGPVVLIRDIRHFN